MRLGRLSFYNKTIGTTLFHCDLSQNEVKTCIQLDRVTKLFQALNMYI